MPLRAELQERYRSYKKRSGAEIQAPRILAGSVFDRAEKRRQQESTETTCGAYESRENADAFGKALRDELKNGSVAHAEHAHGEK